MKNAKRVFVVSVTLKLIAILLAVAALITAHVANAQVVEPTTVMQRYYCIAGEQPDNDYFQAGAVDISAQPFPLWCKALY